MRKKVEGWLLRRPGLWRALSGMANNPVGRRILAALETRALARMLAQSREGGPDGRALGLLFDTYEPGRSPRAIYDDVFSPERFGRGYQSQVGQDLFLNRWLFKGGGPGFFVDVGAFDGELGSNTYFFEKHLGWTGVAFEPNPPVFEALRRVRSCQAIQGCAYDRSGEVTFLSLSHKDHQERAGKLSTPATVWSMIVDQDHGSAMLSGIRDHIDNMPRVEVARDLWHLDQAVVPIPCYRIDSVLESSGVTTIDYLSIDVEGAELKVLQGIDFAKIRVNVITVERSRCFPDVYRLLTNSGFHYRGLLFFDEVFVHPDPRFSWNSQAGGG